MNAGQSDKGQNEVGQCQYLTHYVSSIYNFLFCEWHTWHTLFDNPVLYKCK